MCIASRVSRLVLPNGATASVKFIEDYQGSEGDVRAEGTP